MFHGYRWAIVGTALPIGLFVLTTACGTGTSETPAGDAEPREAATLPVTTAITAAEVANATIAGVFATPFTFADGSYEGPPVVPGGSSSPMAVLMSPLVTLGELDAHPGVDAAALLASNEGGSGERITLAVIGRVDGKAVALATALVGDRTKVRDLRLANRDIVIDVVEIGDGEPACCGTQLAARTYRLDGVNLTLVASQVTGKLSLTSTVADHTWAAVALDGAPLEAGLNAPTLTYADGRVSGNSGCNQYTGPVTESKPGTIAVGPTAGTRRACVGNGAALEARFLKTLGVATRYTFLAGQLVVSGVEGEQMRTITFRRTPSAR
jgi:heat shock protein HslJ